MEARYDLLEALIQKFVRSLPPSQEYKDRLIEEMKIICLRFLDNKSESNFTEFLKFTSIS